MESTIFIRSSRFIAIPFLTLFFLYMPMGQPLWGQDTIADTTQAWQDYQEALALYKERKVEKAIPLFKKARKGYEKARAWEKYVNACNYLEDSYRRLRKNDSTIYHAKKALKTLTAHLGKQHILASKLHQSISISLNNIGLYKDGIKHDQKALDILLKSLDSPNLEVARCYNSIGSSWMSLEDFDKAIELFEKALEIRVRLLDTLHIKLIQTYNNLGAAYHYKGNFEKTIFFYTKGLNILTSLGNHKEYTAAIYNNLGGLYSKMKDYDLALEYYKKALSIWAQVYEDQHPHIAGVYSNLARNFQYSGNYDLAIEYFEKSLQMRVDLFGKRHPQIAVSIGSVGKAYFDKGDYDTAYEYFKKALALRLTLPETPVPELAESYHDLGRLSSKRGNNEMAFSYYEKGLNILLQSSLIDHPDLMAYYSNIGELYHERGDFHKALEFHQQQLITALPDFKATDWQVNPSITKKNTEKLNVLLALRNKGLTLSALYKEKSNNPDHLTLAIETYLLAIKLMEWMKHDYKYETSKLMLDREFRDVYENVSEAIKLLYDREPANELMIQLFNIVEKSKSGILRQMHQESKARHFAGIPDSLLEKEKSLRFDISYYGTEIEKRKSVIEGYDTTLLSGFENRLFQLNRDYEKLITLFENKYPQYHRLKYQYSVSGIPEIQSLLDKETSFIEYFITDNSLFIFNISAQDYRVESLPLPSNFKALVNNLRYSLTNEFFIETSVDSARTTYLNNAYQLYQILLQQAVSKLPKTVKNLIIAPDALLTTVPFEILLTQPLQDRNGIDLSNPEFFKGLPYLLRDFSISYAYSATLMREQLTRPKRDQKPVGIFAGFAPSYDAFKTSEIDSTTKPMLTALVRSGEQHLPGALAEVTQIADMFSGDTWLREKATENNFKSAASNYRFLHLAMHGLLDDRTPSLSKLLFTPSSDSTEDNFLHASEVYGSVFNADMIVLSACNTGYGTLQEGEGMMSLSRAFAYAGCPSVVNSLWKAPDKATSKIMVDFYKGLKEGKNKAQALREAKLAYLTSSKGVKSHPFYWSAFIINGDVTAVDMEESGKLWWVAYLLGATLFVAVGIYLFKYRLSRQN